MSDPDSVLLHRFATAGDHDAFATLVRRRIDLVYAAALRQLGGDAHRAQDVTQEVFIALARKAATLARHPALIAWLHTTARYAAVNAIRVEQRRARREEQAFTMHDHDETTAAGSEQQLGAVLDATLHELNDRDRTAVLLRFFGQASFSAMAGQLGLTENAAQKRVDRALDRLRAALARRGIASTGAALAAALASEAAIVAPEPLAAAVTASAVGALAAGGGAASAWTIFLMTKLKLAAVGAIVLAGAAALVIQYQHNARLQEENDRLQQAARDAARAHVDHPPAHPSPDAPAPSRVAPAPVAATPAASATPDSTDLVPAANLQNAGNATPAAAYESIFWAVTHHDVETLGRLIALSERGKARAAAAFEKVPAPVIDGTHITTPEEMIGYLFTSKMGELSALRIGNEKEKTPDDATVAGALQHPNGQSDAVHLDFHRGVDGWQWQISDKMVLYASDEWERAMLTKTPTEKPAP